MLISLEKKLLRGGGIEDWEESDASDGLCESPPGGERCDGFPLGDERSRGGDSWTPLGNTVL